MLNPLTHSHTLSHTAGDDGEWPGVHHEAGRRPLLLGVCERVCVRERERLSERERERERERKRVCGGGCVGVCVRERERERD